MFVGPDRTLHTDEDVPHFARTRVKSGCSVAADSVRSYSMPWWVDTTVSTQPLHDLSHRRETRGSSVGSGPLAVEMPMITEPKPRNVGGETS